MVVMRTSRLIFSTMYSCVYPYPPSAWMLASAAALPASVAMYFAMAPSVFRLPSTRRRCARRFPRCRRGAASSRTTCGHDQLVRVSLLFRERRSRLNALGGIRNRAIERGPSGPEDRKPPPSGACNRIPPGPDSAPGLPPHRSAGRHRRIRR